MMNDQSGEDDGFDISTLRGRDYPTIRQFTVFLENRVGRLMELLRKFDGSGVRIVAINIHDSTECSLVRVVLTDPERGREILERAGLAMIESDLVAVELPDDPQPLLRVCTALLSSEINLVQAYPLLGLQNGNQAVALMVDNCEIAADTLQRKGFRVIEESDLNR
jgi:hypothetical protein